MKGDKEEDKRISLKKHSKESKSTLSSLSFFHVDEARVEPDTGKFHFRLNRRTFFCNVLAVWGDWT